MAFKMLMVPLLLFLNRDICNARSSNPLTEELRKLRFRIEDAPLAQNRQNMTECDSLQLAKTYTNCSLPLYIDLMGVASNFDATSLCSPVDTFILCVENGLKNTHCSNVANPIGPTLMFFTSSVLNSYSKRCNLSSDVDGVDLAIYTNLTSPSTNQSLTEELPSPQDSFAKKSVPESDHDKRSGPLKSLGVKSGKASVEQPKELDTVVSGNPESSQGLKSEQSNLTVPTEQQSANELNIDERFPEAPSTNDSASSSYFLIPGVKLDPTEESSAEVRFEASTSKIGPISNANDLTANGEVKATHVVQDSNELSRMKDDPKCPPGIDVNYTFPATCETNILLRRMFTCGVAMHEFILMKQDVCTCFMGYKQCVIKAKTELGCGNATAPVDPVLYTVKLIEALMMSWYQNPCALYDNTTRGRSASCNSTRAAISSVVCYATYFAMSELKTPAPWTSTGDSCSAVNDVNRCLISAERNTNCTTPRFTAHSRLFLKVITSNKQQECPLDAGFFSNQDSGLPRNPGCQRSKALKRAIKCALSFQDLADVERNFNPPLPVPCGHISRLHSCLEDSVEGTGCYGDISVHSEIKVYKKVLEDAYDAHCLVDGQMDSALSFHANGKHYLMRSHANKHSIQFRGGLGDRSWRKDLGLPENTEDENSEYYYDDSSDRRKTVFAGPRGVIVMHPDDTEDDFEYEKLNSDTLDRKVLTDQGKRVAGWRPLTDRQQGKPVVEGNRNFTSYRSPAVQVLLHFPEIRMASSKETDAKRPHEDDYFFGNDVENARLVMLPSGLDMFRHIRGGAVIHMESVVGENTSDYKGIDCPVAKVQLALGLCNATLRGLLSQWPNISDIGLPLDGSSSGVKEFCSELKTYKGCLRAVLNSYHCNQGNTINDIFEIYRKNIRLPYCASGADFSHLSYHIILSGLLTSLMARYF